MRDKSQSSIDVSFPRVSAIVVLDERFSITPVACQYVVYQRTDRSFLTKDMVYTSSVRLNLLVEARKILAQ